MHVGQRRVRVGKVAFQFKGLVRERPGFVEGVGRRQRVGQRVVVGQTGIRRRVGRVGGNRLLEILARAAHVRLASGAHEVTALQIHFLDQRIRLAQRGDFTSGAASETRPNLVDDRPRECALAGQNACSVTVVGLGPEMRVAFRIDQLYRDPHLLSLTDDRALDDGADAQLLRDLPQGLGGGSVMQRRCLRDHFQFANLGERRDERLRHAEGHIPVRRALRHVGGGEGQHGD